MNTPKILSPVVMSNEMLSYFNESEVRIRDRFCDVVINNTFVLEGLSTIPSFSHHDCNMFNAIWRLC